MKNLIQDNELFNAVLALVVLIFLVTQLRRLQKLPKRVILLFAYGTLFVGWVATLLEGVVWPGILNTAEHICYAVGALLFSIWCWVALQPTSRDSS